jgi:aminoglycoside 6-adenylyltransferase
MMAMRTEREMFDLILGVARGDERIRAVYMNGSRANPDVAKDAYRDYDIVFTVEETGSFLSDKDWIKVFGDVAIVQEPDSNDLGWGDECDFSQSYCWLILFKDGNRIDLRIMTKESAIENYLTDTLSVPLLDKDGCLPQIPASSDRGYWTRPPTKERYRGCCNEFWWCLNNVAKGIVRRQLSYAMRMYFDTVHVELEKMLDWYIAMGHDYKMTTGMWGKYYEKYLPEQMCALFTKTYSDGNYAHLWSALFNACTLFSDIARQVGGHCGFEYREDEETNTVEYLKRMENCSRERRGGGCHRVI